MNNVSGIVINFSGVIGNHNTVAQNVPDANIHPTLYVVPKNIKRYVHPDIMNHIGK